MSPLQNSLNLHSVCNLYCNTRGNSSRNCPIVNVNTNLPAGDYMDKHCGNCSYDPTTKILSCGCNAYDFDTSVFNLNNSTSIDASKCKRVGASDGNLVCSEPCQTPTETPTETPSSCKKWSTESITSFAVVGGVLLLVILALILVLCLKR